MEATPLNPRHARRQVPSGAVRRRIDSPGLGRRGGSAREEGEPADLERHPHPACLLRPWSRARPSVTLGHPRPLTRSLSCPSPGQQRGRRVEKVSRETRRGTGRGGGACAWKVLQVTVSRCHSRYTWSPAGWGFTIGIRASSLFNVSTRHFCSESSVPHHRACARVRPTRGSRTDIPLPLINEFY